MREQSEKTIKSPKTEGNFRIFGDLVFNSMGYYCSLKTMGRV